MSWTKRLIYFTIYWIFLSSIINRYVWNSAIITLIPDVLVIGIFLYNPIRKKSISKISSKTVLITFTTFLTIGILSAIINTTQLTSFLWGFRMIIRYPLLFYITYQHFNLKDVFILKKNLYLSFWINAIFIILQFSQGVVGDPMGGIWSGNGILTIYILISIVIYGSDYFLGKISLINFSARVVFFFICATWGEIKILYFIIPFIIYIEYCFYKKFNLSHLFIIVIAYFSLIPILQWGLSLYYDKDYVDSVFDTEALEEYNNNDYGFSGYSYNRGTCIQLATAQFLKDPFHLLFGHGIGSATVSKLFPSKIGAKYGEITCYYYFTCSYVLIEVGWVGFTLYLLFHIFLFYSFFKSYIKSKNINMKNWSAIGCLSVIITFIMIYYNSSPYSDYYIMYLLWAICFIAIRDCKKITRNKIKQVQTSQSSLDYKGIP